MSLRQIGVVLVSKRKFLQLIGFLIIFYFIICNWKASSHKTSSFCVNDDELSLENPCQASEKRKAWIYERCSMITQSSENNPFRDCIANRIARCVHITSLFAYWTHASIKISFLSRSNTNSCETKNYKYSRKKCPKKYIYNIEFYKMYIK